MTSILSTKNLNLSYGSKQTLFDVDISFEEKSVTALIGPSGCGKSTLLRCMNRMNDLIPDCKITGDILYRGENITTNDPVLLRRKIGMVFQRQNPFPKSIYDNIAYGPRAHGEKDKILWMRSSKKV